MSEIFLDIIVPFLSSFRFALTLRRSAIKIPLYPGRYIGLEFLDKKCKIEDTCDFVSGASERGRLRETHILATY